MRRSPLFGLSLAWLLLVAGCGAPKPEPCGPQNCNGCCDSTGQCRGGNETNACGVSGGLCFGCLGGQLCQFGLCITPGSGGGGGTGGGAGGGSATGGGAGGGAATSCDDGCFTPTPHCDTGTNTCVGCLGNQNCPSATPVCEPTAKRCVACATNLHCSGSAPWCDTATNTCATCTATQGCTPGSSVCDTSVPGGRCVGCLGNGDCSGATPVCDTATNSCVRCSTAQGCSGATPVCDTTVAGGQCVGCTAQSHCGGATPVCNTTTKTCVTCLSNSHCGGATPICDTSVAGGQCVGCTASTQCSGATPVCDPGSKTCVRCTATSGCSGTTPICDTAVAGGQCVGCLSSATCGGATPVCDPASKTCVRCTATSGCSGTTPVCDTAVAGGQCVGCVSSANCGGATPVCNTTTRQCVTCLSNANCGGSTPVCDTSVTGGQCVGCTSSANCGGTTPVCNTTTKTCVRCTATAGCSGATPVCDTSVTGGQCVGCLSSANCGGSTPVCNTTTRTCVTCLSNSNCGGSTPICDTSVAGGQCVGCTQSSQCGGTTPICNTTTKTCVRCTATAGCSGATPYCDTAVAGGQCVGCLSSANCGGSTPVCNPTTRQCVGCVSSTDCGGGTPVCLTATGTCVQCTSSTHCGGSTPLCDTATSRCVGCFNDGHCSGGTPRCNTTSGACVQCTSSAHCANPAPVCSAANTCGGCTTTLECGAGTSCQAPNCVANPETCATAQVLPLGPGQTMLNFQADLRRAIADHQGSCGLASGPELVYRLTLPQAHDVTISVAKAPGQPTSDPVFFVRRGDCTTGAELACVDETFSNGVETKTLYGQAAGDLYLFIEAYGSSYAVLTDVSIVLTPPTPPPPNDTCATPTLLTFTGNEASASGSLVLATNASQAGDASPTCSSGARTAGRDVVYRYTLTQAQDVRLDVQATGGAFTPVVYVRRLADCANASAGTELACAAGTAAGVSTRLINQQPGDYVLWVDQTEEREAGFSLSVTLLPPTLPPANDTCASPEALVFTGGLASTTGQTVGATNDYFALACPGMAGANGRDVVYAVSVPAPGPVSVVVASQSSDWAPVVSMSEGCPTSGDLDCTTGRAGAVAGALVAQADAGVHYVFVDGLDGGGFFRLDGRLGAPPNDTCATAAPLTASTLTVDHSVLDHTRLATNAIGQVCTSTTSFAGKDLFYTFTPATSGTVTLTVWPDSNFDVALGVLSGSCGALTCVATRDVGARGGTEVLNFAVTAGTTYFVVVDGYGYVAGPSEGFFRLELR